MKIFNIPPARSSLSAIFLILGVVTAAWAVMVPLIRLKMGMDEAQLARLIFCFGAGAFFAIPTARKLLDKYASDKVVRWFAFATLPAVSIVAFLPNPISLGAFLFALGMLIATLDIAINANAVEVEAEIKRPAMSSFHGFYSIGGLAGLAFGVFAEAWGMLGVSIACGGLAFLGVLLVHRDVLHVPLVAPIAGEKVKRSWLKDISLPLVVISLACLSLFSLEGAVIDWSGVYAEKYLGAPPKYYGFCFAVFSVVMAISRFAGDYMRLRFRGRHLVLVGCIIAAIAYFLIARSTTIWMAAFGYGLLGLGFGNIVPILFVMVARLPNIKASDGLAIAAGLGYVGLLAIPPLIGLFASTYGLPKVFLGLAFAALATSAVVLVFPPRPEDEA